MDLYFSYLYVMNHKINMFKNESLIHQHVSIPVNSHLTSGITNYLAAQKEDASFPPSLGTSEISLDCVNFILHYKLYLRVHDSHLD